jgi:hypothetical protein
VVLPQPDAPAGRETPAGGYPSEYLSALPDHRFDPEYLVDVLK